MTGRSSRRGAALALTTLVLGLALPAAGAVGAAALPEPTGLGTSTAVELDPPIDGAREIGVAAGGDRVVAIDRGSVLAYDLSGHLRARYDAPSAQFGFRDLVLDDAGALAYALSSQGDEVLAFELPNLRLLGRAKLSDGPCADALALAGDRVWVAGPCGLASLPPSLEGLTAATGAPQAVYQVHTQLTATGQHGTTLYARGASSEGRVVDRFDLAGPTATLATRQIVPDAEESSFPGLSFAVTTDGATLLDGPRLLDGQTLALRRTLLPTTRLEATFLAGDTHLFGVLHTATSSTAVWSVDHDTPAATFGAGADATLVATDVGRTVGYATDGRTLQVVHFGGELPRLSLDPRPHPTSDAVSGRLELTDGTAAAGHPVVVERVDLHGATRLGVASTDAEGRFTVDDPGAAVGTPTYRVRWYGDLAHPDGAFAILPARDGAIVPTPATDPPAGATVRLRDVPVRQMVADEAHGRLLVLSWKDAVGNTRAETHLDVFGLDGTAAGEVTPASPPVSMTLTADGTHLLLVEPGANQVEILDAATLGTFAVLRTAPLVHQPGSVTAVGTDLWLPGGGSHLRVGLSAPTEARLAAFPRWVFTPRTLTADRAHPGFAYATSVPDALLERWDLRPAAPVQVANGTVQGGWFAPLPLTGPVPGAPLREVSGTGTIDHDPVTLVEVGRRWDDAASVGDDEEREHVVAAVAGPDATHFLALEGEGPQSARIWLGPIQPSIDGHLAVWDGGSQPYRRIPIWDVPLAVAVTGSGSTAFVATAGLRSLGGEASPSETRRWLRVIPDPFAYAPAPTVAAPDAPPPPPPPSTTTTTATTLPPTTTTTTPTASVALRLSGPDRIGTAVATSRDAWRSLDQGGPRPLAGAVVLARADLFSDALAGTPLAHHVDGPILLSASASLDGRTLAEIARILPPGGTVHLLGGPSALGPSVASDLAAAGYVVARHAGADRYATAVAIAELLDPSEVLLVTGRSFPDGLSAGAAAARRGGAVLLTDGAAMAPATAAYLAAHPGLVATAIGGPAAQAAPGVTGILGADRYGTAVAVAQAFFPSTVGAVGIASGESFADALAGGAHVARLGGPLLLTRPTALPGAVLAFVVSHHPAQVLLYGGAQAIGTEVAAALA